MLESKTCIPCKGGIPPLTRREAEKFLAEVPQWRLDEEATIITRRYKFENFVQALEFTNRVGNLAEAENHHPDITLGWGYCEVQFYTHKIHGLHENDFIMARKTDLLYSENQ